MKARLDKDWVRCSCCGHKLGRIINDSEYIVVAIEIKCHSCKKLNTLECGREKS